MTKETKGDKKNAFNALHAHLWMTKGDERDDREGERERRKFISLQREKKEKNVK